MWGKKKEKKEKKEMSVGELFVLQGQHKKLEEDIKELEKADEFLCPRIGEKNSIFVPIQEYHNPLVRQAIEEKIRRLRKEQEELKILI